MVSRKMNWGDPDGRRRFPDRFRAQVPILPSAIAQPVLHLGAQGGFPCANRDPDVAPEFGRSGNHSKIHATLQRDAGVYGHTRTLKMFFEIQDQFGRFHARVVGFELIAQAAVHLIPVNAKTHSKQPAAVQVHVFQFAADARRLANQSRVGFEMTLFREIFDAPTAAAFFIRREE